MRHRERGLEDEEHKVEEEDVDVIEAFQVRGIQSGRLRNGDWMGCTEHTRPRDLSFANGERDTMSSGIFSAQGMILLMKRLRRLTAMYSLWSEDIEIAVEHTRHRVVDRDRDGGVVYLKVVTVMCGAAKSSSGDVLNYGREGGKGASKVRAAASVSGRTVL